MKLYVSFLKLLGLLLLIPIGLAIVIGLGFVGLSLDFGNAWENKASGSGGSSSLYMLILPFGFICITGWIIYVLSKRNSARRAENQETKIRRQVYKEQELGTNTHDIVVNMLIKHGSMTADKLSQKLNINQEKMLEVIRELLQAGRIRQDLAQQPPQFYVLSQGSNDNEDYGDQPAS